MKTETVYPDQYLHVRECRTGQEWIVPLSDSVPLVLEDRVREWIQSEFSDELELDGGFSPALEGDYYAQIMTGGNPPDSVVVWESGGFYLKSTYA